MKPDVSIIMPVYNSSEYLRNAVYSILNQSYTNFEVILVDDGSKDNSGNLCDELALQDERVIVIHKENGGICSARNAGLEVARGEYIGFCDNDDEYLPGLIEDNYVLAKNHDVDVMRYSKQKVIVNGEGKINKMAPSEIVDMFIDDSKYGECFTNVRKECTVWSAFYRKKLIDRYKIRFNENFKFGNEDIFFNLDVLQYSNRLGFNSKTYYAWMQRESHSTSKQFHPEFLDNTRECIIKEYDFIKSRCGKIEDIDLITFSNNTYIYQYITYMENKGCQYSLQEKVEILRDIRKLKLFDWNYSKNVRKEIRKKSFRMYLQSMLFYYQHFKLLLCMYKVWNLISSKILYR